MRPPGYAKTVLIVDAPGDWFGSTRLGALRYEHAPIERLYPFGTAVSAPTQSGATRRP